jgi:hypothetical protein
MSNLHRSTYLLPNLDMKQKTLIRGVALLGIVGILMGALLPALL